MDGAYQDGSLVVDTTVYTCGRKTTGDKDFQKILFTWLNIGKKAEIKENRVEGGC